jgi:hypothetical protein
VQRKLVVRVVTKFGSRGERGEDQGKFATELSLFGRTISRIKSLYSFDD